MLPVWERQPGIRTDVASAGPGNSGGPAVNDAGEQVGVVSAGSRNELDCQDYNGDGQIDVVSECVTPSGGIGICPPDSGGVQSPNPGSAIDRADADGDGGGNRRSHRMRRRR